MPGRLSMLAAMQLLHPRRRGRVGATRLLASGSSLPATPGASAPATRHATPHSVPGDVPGATLRAGLLATLLTCGPTLLSACGPSIEYLPGLLEAPRTPRPRRPETVEILSGDRGGRPYFEIGTLIAGPAAVTSASEKAALLRRLRARAAEVGCDALVVGETVAAAASPGGGGDGRRTIRASCVVFVDDKR